MKLTFDAWKRAYCKIIILENPQLHFLQLDDTTSNEVDASISKCLHDEHTRYLLEQNE